MLQQITPLILTYNESPNIGRTLQQLAWAHDIVVIDSFSTDDTLTIVSQFPHTRVVQRRFDTFAEQCNFGLKQLRTQWALSLDADYVLSRELVDELHQLQLPESVVGYLCRFQYCVHGRPLRASLYPPRTVLYRIDKARYMNEGHGHRVFIDGPVKMLNGAIYHDDRKSLERWFHEQLKYASKESQHLLSTPGSQLGFVDRIRRWTVVAPFLVLVYTLLGKGLVLDGWRGWYYVLQRTLAEVLLSLELLEAQVGMDPSQKVQ